MEKKAKAPYARDPGEKGALEQRGDPIWKRVTKRSEDPNEAEGQEMFEERLMK